MLRSWIHLSIIIVMLLGVYIFTDIYIALWTLMIIVGLVVASILLLLFMQRKVHIQLMTSWSTYKSEEGMINIHIQNKSVLPVTQVKCVLLFHNLLTGKKSNQETYVMIKGKGEEIIPLYFTSGQIGKIEISVKELIIYDYLHLFKQSIRLESTNETYIIPHETPIRFVKQYNHFGLENGMQLTNLEIAADGTEMIGIKEYQEGDNAKHIHWKLTNKFNFPIVKEFSEPVSEKILVVYDHYHIGNAQEINAKVETFLSLSKSLIDEGYEHQITWFDHQMRTEDIYMAEQLISLQPSILSIQHQRDQDSIAVDIINNNMQYYSHIYVITSEENRAMKSLIGHNQVTVLTYCEETDYIPMEQSNHVLFRANRLQEDLSYLTI